MNGELGSETLQLYIFKKYLIVQRKIFCRHGYKSQSCGNDLCVDAFKVGIIVKSLEKPSGAVNSADSSSIPALMSLWSISVH